MNMLSVKSAMNGDDYGKKFTLIDQVSISRTPRLGALLNDKNVNSKFRSRDFMKMKCDFREISAIRIDDSFISNQYIVHDKNNIYVDSSILCASALDRGITSSPHLSSTAARVPADFTVDDSYADQEVMVFHNEGGGTWGHFLVQNIPRALLLRQRFPHVKIAVPTGQRPSAKNNFSKTLSAFGINENNSLYVDAAKTYRFRSVWIMDFLYSWKSGSQIHPYSLDMIKNYYNSDEITLSPRAYNNAFFVDRVATTRSIENKYQVISTFDKFSIECLTLGKLSPHHQFDHWSRAHLACGILGSDLTNMIFAKDGAAILVLSPHEFGDVFFYNLAAAKNIRWFEIRCGHVTNPADPKHSTFTVDTDLLEATLESIA